MTKEVVDSIIFDLDGTLWDSTEQVVKAWNQVISKHNEVIKGITPQDIKGVMGLQIKEIGKKFFPYLDEEVQMKVMDECCKTECELLRIHGGSLYEKLEETLKVLTESYKLFIVSNCACGYIEAFLEAHNLEKYFIDFENPGRTGLSKGENIKIIIERNNLSNPVYVGDTEGDKKATVVAEIPFVYARYGFGEVKDYDYVIDKVSELLKLPFLDSSDF